MKRSPMAQVAQLKRLRAQGAHSTYEVAYLRLLLKHTRAQRDHVRRQLAHAAQAASAAELRAAMAERAAAVATGGVIEVVVEAADVGGGS